MAAHVAIDGYNLIRSRGDATFGDLEQEREDLLRDLKTYRRLRKVKLTVVFDGTASGRLTRGSERVSGIEVVFSRHGEQADRVLKELAARKGQNLTVVSSDREVADYARAKGSVALSSGEFEDLLQMALYEDLKGVDPYEDEEDEGTGKGPARKASKAERRKKNRIKKL